MPQAGGNSRLGRSRCSFFVYVGGFFAAVGVAFVVQRTLREYEAALRSNEQYREELSRLAAQLKKTQREKLEQETGRKEAEDRVLRAKNESERWRHALLNASAFWPLTALLGREQFVEGIMAVGRPRPRPRSAAQSKSQQLGQIAIEVIPPFAFAAEAAYHHAVVLHCVYTSECSLGVLDVLAYALMNILLAAFHFLGQPTISAKFSTASGGIEVERRLRSEVLSRGRQLLWHVEKIQAEPFDTNDEGRLKLFAEVLQDLFAFKAEVLVAIAAVVPWPIKLPLRPVAFMPFGLQGSPPSFTPSLVGDRWHFNGKSSFAQSSRLTTKTCSIWPLTLRVAPPSDASQPDMSTVPAIVKAIRQGWRQLEVPIGGPGLAEDVSTRGTSTSALTVAAEVLAQSGALRGELILQGVLDIASDMHVSGVEDLVRSALDTLGAQRFDFLLLRRPHGGKLAAADWHHFGDFADLLVKEGLVVHFGIVNVGNRPLSDIIRVLSSKKSKGKVAPLVLQNKLSVFYPGHDEDEPAASGQSCIMHRAWKQGIIFQGYGATMASPGLLDPVSDPHVRVIAQRHRRPATQVLMRWALQLGAAMVVDPVREGLSILADAEAALEFALPSGDMRQLSGIAGLRRVGLSLDFASRRPSRSADNDVDDDGHNSCVEDVYGMGAMFGERVQSFAEK